MALKYKVDDCALWINGTEVATDTSAAMPLALNRLNFDRSDGANDFNVKSKKPTSIYRSSYRRTIRKINKLIMKYIFKKYEFDSQSQAETRIDALPSVTDEDGNESPSHNLIQL